MNTHLLTSQIQKLLTSLLYLINLLLCLLAKSFRANTYISYFTPINKPLKNDVFLHNYNTVTTLTKLTIISNITLFSSSYSNFLLCPIFPHLILLILEPVKNPTIHLFVLTLKCLNLGHFLLKALPSFLIKSQGIGQRLLKKPEAVLHNVSPSEFI